MEYVANINDTLSEVRASKGHEFIVGHDKSLLDNSVDLPNYRPGLPLPINETTSDINQERINGFEKRQRDMQDKL